MGTIINFCENSHLRLGALTSYHRQSLQTGGNSKESSSWGWGDGSAGRVFAARVEALGSLAIADRQS